MPLQATSGAASYDAFGGGVAVVPNYIEDVFSTWLYTGNGSTQTINNGIDLAGKGGLVWIKDRSRTTNHWLADTVRGVNKLLSSDTTSAQDITTASLTAFNSNGFSIDANGGYTNINGDAFASWTFREQSKFFDVVTWTGDDAATRQIAHSLGSTPGCVIIKSLSTSVWWVWHRSLGTSGLLLNYDFAAAGYTYAGKVNNSNSTQLTVGSGGINDAGVQYVAYLFAHDAGGFGLTGTDNVISCGSFTTDATGAAGNITLGYEPQWLLVKRADNTGNWLLIDTMRGSSLTAYSYLSPNTSSPESSSTTTQGVYPTTTGFFVGNNFPAPFATYIYIAIRRGPMKVPTDGTSVFFPKVIGGQGITQNITGFGFPVDLAVSKQMTGTQTWAWTDRLRGATRELTSAGTSAETTYVNDITSFALMDGFIVGSGAGGNVNTDGNFYDHCGFRRAPGFFDEVCYTGTGSALNPNHNLGVVPELKIIKSRSGDVPWIVGGTVLGGGVNFYMFLETNAIVESTNYWNSGSDSATTFSTRAGNSASNSSGQTYVAYLFATCPGVSKVGSYTGNGTTQTINCGFTSGARFVMIKRTDAAGGWYVYDTARGMTTLFDPYLQLNSTAEASATLGSVTTVSTGFALNATILAAINTNAASYIFLAIS